MKIESVSRKDDNNVIVHLDNGEKLYLSYEILLKNGLKKNDEISEDRFSFLVSQNQLYFIKQRAINYMARRLHSVNELRIKLKQKGYELTLINEVLNDLVEKNYLNDYDFASQYADENIRNKSWGRNKLKAELFKKGVSAGIISRVLEERINSGEEELEAASALAGKKLKALSSRNLEPRKLKEKLISFLLARGYSFDIANRAVTGILKNDDDDVYAE
jgi:regulatory protein